MNQVTKMNKNILIAMDHENRSKEELKKNLDAAYEAAVAVRAAYAAAVRADSACYAAKYATLPFLAANTEYWIDEYFQITGEDKEEYEKALKEMRE